jgi:hypothetical protein
VERRFTKTLFGWESAYSASAAEQTPCDEDRSRGQYHAENALATGSCEGLEASTEPHPQSGRAAERRNRSVY